MDSTLTLKTKKASALLRIVYSGARSFFVFFVLISTQQDCYAALAPGIIDANQTICSGTAPATITNTISGSNTGGMFTYFWRQSTTAAFSGYTNIPAANSATYTPGILTISTWFRRGVTNGIDTVYADPVKITVTPASAGGFLVSSRNGCFGSDVTTLSTIGSVGSVLYWESSPNFNFIPTTTIANTDTVLVIQNPTPTLYYRAVLQNGTCPIARSTLKQVSTSIPVTNGIITTPNFIVCGNTDFELTLNAYTGTILYWESSPNVSFIPATTINSTASHITGNINVITYFRAVLSTGTCPLIYSSHVAMEPTPPSIGGIVNGSTSYCSNTNSTILQLSGHSGNIMRWESSPSPAFTTFTTIPFTGTSLTLTNITTTTYYRAVVQKTSCSEAFSDTGRVEKVTTLAKVSGGATVCSGTNSTVLTLSGNSGSIVKWESSPVADFSSGLINLANTNNTYTALNLTSTKYYRAILANSPCPADTSGIDSIVVTPQTVGGIVSGNNDSVCVGTNSTTLTLSGYTGTIQWQTSTTSAVSGFSNIIGATGTTYIATNLSVKTYFRAIVTSGVCTSATSVADSVLMRPPSVGGTISGGGTFCPGPIAIPLSLAGHTGTIVKWQSSTSPTFSSGITDILATVNPYNTLAITPSTLYYRAIVKNGVCPEEPSSISQPVIVLPQTVAGQVTGGTTVCAPNNSTTLTLTGYTGNILKWQSSLIANFGSATDITNTTNSLTVNNLSVKTFYRALVQNGTCMQLLSAKDSISIHPIPVGGILSGGNTVCAGTNSTTLTLTGYVGSILNWQWSTSSTFSSGINNISNTTNTYTATNLTATRYYRAVVTSLFCAAQGVSYSSIEPIIVIPQVVGGTLSGGAAVCTGTNSTLLTLSSYSGSIVKWESSPVANFSSGVVNLANTNNTYTALNLTSTTYYRAILTGSPCPADTSDIDSIVVAPQTVGGSVLGGGSICPGNTSKLLTLSGYTGTIIKWQSSTVSNFSANVTDIANTTNTYTAANLTGLTYYRVVVQSGNCTIVNSATTSVSPPPIPGALSGGNSYCSATNNTTFTLTGSSGTIVRWESCLASNFSLGITLISNSTTSLNVLNAAVTTYYRVLVSGGGISCPGAYSTIDSIVISPPSVGGIVSGNNDSVCVGTNSSTLTLSGHTGTIQWQVSTTSATSGFSNIIGATGTTYIATNLSVKTYYRAIVTSGVCASATSVADSVLMRSPSIGGTVSGNDTVCTGTNSTTLTLTGYTGTIQWQSSTSSATTGFSNIVGANASIYIATNLSVKTYFRAIVTNGICASSTSSADSIFVNAISVGGIISGSDSVCSGANSTLLTLSGFTGTIIRWESANNVAFTGIVTQIANTTINHTATNLSTTTYYRAVVQNGNCPIVYSSAKAIIVVPPSFGGFITAPTTVCINTNSTVITITGYAGTILRWESSTTSNFSTITTIAFTGPSYTAVNITTPMYYRAVVQNGVCPSAYSLTGFINVQVQPNPGTVMGGTNVCISSNSTILNLSGYQGNIVRWESSNTADFSGTITTIANTTNSYGVNNLTTTTYYRAVVQYLNCATVNSGVAGIIVNPVSIAGTFTSTNDTVCTGTNSTALTLTGQTGTIQWQASTTSATAGFSNIVGANTSSYIATNLSVKTYYRAIITSGACPSATSAVDSILINPISVGGTVSGSNDTVCIGTNSTTLTLSGHVGTIQWQASTTSATSGFSNIVGANASIYIASNLSVKTYYRAIITSWICTSATSAVDSILINPLSVGGTVSGSNDTVCIGTNSTILTLTGHTGTVQWQASTTSATTGFSNIVGAITSAYIATNLSVKTYYRAIVTSGVCPSATSSVDSILINPISVGGVVSGNKDTVCIGTNSTTLTLTGHAGAIQWQVSTTSATTGFSNIVGANALTYIATNLSVKTYYRAIVTSGVCPPATSSVDSILINPISIGGTVSGSNDTVCIGTNSTTLTLSGHTGTIQWQASITSATTGFSNIVGANALTYIVTNLSVKTYYRAIVTSGVCPSATSSVDSILINPISVGGVVLGNQDIVCTGTNSTTLTLSGHVGTIQWQASTTSATAGFSNIVGANTSTYIASNLSVKTYYRAIVTSGVCPSATSSVDSILINPISVGGTVSGSNDTVCTGTNSTTLTLTGHTGTIQWQVSTTSATAGFSNIIGANASTYIATNLSVKTYYRAIITSGVCPSATSSVDSILINPISVGGVVSGSNDTVCIGTNSTTLTLSGYVGTIQWQVSTTSATTGFSNIVGANASTYIATNLSVKTYYRAIITSGVCASITSSVDSILINPISVGGVVSGNHDTVCIGTNSTILTLTGHTGIIQWQVSTTSVSAGFSNIIGANASTYIATNLSIKTYYRAIVTSWICPPATSTVDSILINPISVGGIVSGSNDTVCIGTNSTTLSLSGYTGSIQWQASTSSAIAGFSNIVGANASTYITTNLSVKTYYRAIVTSGVCPSITSSVDSILINPISVGGTVSGSNDTVCIGTNSTTLTLSGYVGTIQWQASTTSATTGFSNIIGANTSTYIASNLSVKTYYRAIVTSGVCPSATSSVDSILINLLSVGGTVSGSNDIVCIGTNSTTLTLSGYVGTIQWQVSTTSATSGFSNIIGANILTYTATNLSVKTYYRAIVTSGVCPSATSSVDSILINPLSVGGGVLGNKDTVCIGTNSTNLTLSGHTGTIQWQASISSATTGFSNIVGANASTYIATNLSVKTYYRVIITNGVCPSATSSADSILINPVSVGGIVSGSNDTVCIGTNSTTLTLTGHTGTIQWQASTSSATTGFSNIVGANTSIYIASNLSVKTYYRAIVTSGVCPSATSSVDSILINPISVGGVVSGNHDTVCIGTNSTTLTLTGHIGTIQWQVSTTSATTGFSNIIGANASTYIATNLSVKTYYRAIVTSGVCPSATSSVDSILINPISVGGTVSGSNDTVCIGTNLTTLTLTGHTGTIHWQASTSSAIAGFSNIVGANASTYITTNLSVKTYYRAIVTSGVCPSITSSVDSILINPLSVGGTVSGSNDTVCIGTNSTTLTLSGHTGTIQWQASITSATTGFSNIVGANALTYIVTNLSVKTYYRAIVTSGVCPSATSSVDSILINPISVGGVVLGNHDTVCTGTNSTTLTLSGHTGTIQWQASTSSATTGFSNIIGANASTYITTNLSVKTYYRAIVTSGVCPSITSSVDSILINPVSVGGTVSGSNDTVCIGTNSTTLTLAGHVGTIQWQVSTTSATTGFSNIIGATNAIYIATNLSVKTYYRAIITSGVCAFITSSVDSILINPISVGGVVSGNHDTVCIGTNSTILTLTGHTGIIQWQVSTTSVSAGFSNIVGANASSYITSNLSVKTYYRAIVTSWICPPATSTVDSILINPISVGGIVSGSNDTVCTGTNSTTLSLSGYTGSIQWQASTSSATTGFSNIVGANASTYIANNLSVKTYYRAIVTSGICPSVTSAVDSIWVNPAVLTNMINGNMRLCSGSTAELLTGSIPTGGNGSTYSYIWISSTIRSDSGYSPAAGINNTKDFIPGILTQNTWFRRIVYSGPCSVDTSNVLLDTVSLVIAYSIPATAISIVYGTTLILPATVLVKYSDSTSEMRPAVWDTVGYSGNVGTYSYSGSIGLAPGTCNTDSIKGSLTVTVLPRIIIAKADAKIKTIGTPDPPLTYVIISGVLVGSDTFSGFLNRVPGEFVGKYLILQNTLSLPANYTLIYIQDTLTIIPHLIDLGIHKSADRIISQPSDTIHYSITVKNNGPATLFANTTVFIHEYLPDGLTSVTYTALIPSGSNYTQGSGAFILGDTLKPGDSLVLNLTGIIPPSYTQSFITNCVKVTTSSDLLDTDSTNDSSWVTTPLKPYAIGDDIIFSDQIICKGNMASIGLSSTGIINPIFTWYADSLLTLPLSHHTILDTLLLSTTTFFITVKGDNKLENIAGTAKKITVHVHDYASDTLILTHDTMVCYNKSAILVAQPKGPITNPVFTWYADSLLITPIGTGDTFYTPILIKDTLYYVTIKGSDLCESRELHIVKVTINKDCGNINIGLTKALSITTARPDGSYDLTFNFVTKNFGDEPLIDVKLKDDLKPVFPTAQIKVVSLTTQGNWNLNTHYDGTTDIELLDTGNQFNVGDRQAIQLVINLLFPPLDTSGFFKNIAEVRGLSIVNGKPVIRKSKDGIEPNLDSLTTDSSYEPTPIIIKHVKKPKTEEAGSFFIPEGFSPNGDNVHDYFVIENPDQYTLYVAIYNRWGNMLYENRNYDNSWDGKAQKGIVIGEGVPDGTYFYIVEYTDSTGKKNKLAHSLTIVR